MRGGPRSPRVGAWMGLERDKGTTSCTVLGTGFFTNMVEVTVWPQELLDDRNAVIPNADGDSTPWVSIPQVKCQLSVCCGRLSS